MKIFSFLLLITASTITIITTTTTSVFAKNDHYHSQSPQSPQSHQYWNMPEVMFLGTSLSLCISFVREAFRRDPYIYAELAYFPTNEGELKPIEDIAMRVKLNDSLSFSFSAPQYKFTSMELLIIGNITDTLQNKYPKELLSDPFSYLRIFGDRNITRSLSSFSNVFLKEEFIEGTFISGRNNIFDRSFIGAHLRKEQSDFWLSHIVEDLVYGFIIAFTFLENMNKFSLIFLLFLCLIYVLSML